MRRILTLLLSALLYTTGIISQPVRITPFPDVSGYHVLLCDFHIHTVFSDRLEWHAHILAGSQDFYAENAGRFTLHNTGPFFKIGAGEKCILEIKTVSRLDRFELPPLKILNAYTSPGKNLKVNYSIIPEK